MSSDLGKIAESFVKDYFDSLKSKQVYTARFADTYDANKGRWGDPSQKKVIITRKPCDMMLVIKGMTYFCEVKSTENKKGLKSSLFTKQYAERTRIVSAGGNYLYLIYSYAKEKWYWVPFENLNENATWEELDKFFVDIPKVPL